MSLDPFVIYDDNNRMRHKRLVDSDVYSRDRTSYKYDLRGLTLTTSTGEYHDRFLITNEFDGAGNLPSTETGEGYYATDNARKLTYEYDLNGNRKSITHPDGKTFHYKFDGLNRVDGLKNHEQTELLNLTYESNGGRHAITRRGGSTTNYAYDTINRPRSFTQGFAGNTHDLISSFTYNSANQVTKITRSNAGYQYQGNENIEGSYKSNSLNQYYEVAGKTLTYDTNGNFKTDAPVPMLMRMMTKTD